MNLNQVWTGALPRVAAGCALSLMLATSAGCVGEDPGIDPDEQPDNLRRGNATVDAGVARDEPGNAGAHAGVVRAEPGNVTCQADPPKPGFPDASYPPEPVAPDAGGVYFDAGFPRECFGTLVGDGKTCLSHVDLKLEGQKLCEAKGFELADLKLGEGDCAGGSTEGWLSCCAAERPTPSAGSCTGGVIGDGSACIDWTSLKLKASGACEALGATLVGLAGSSDDKCPDGVLYAKYECCKSDTPPPLPVDAGTVPPWVR